MNTRPIAELPAFALALDHTPGSAGGDGLTPRSWLFIPTDSEKS